MSNELRSGGALPVVNESDRNSFFAIRDRFDAAGGVVVNASLRADGQDRDFYELSGVPAGVGFEAEVVDDNLDTVLGRFDAQGNIIDLDDDSGVGLLSRLAGLTPDSGSLVFSVSGYPDFEFEPGLVHGESGEYQLVFRPQGLPVQVVETARNSSFAIRDSFEAPNGAEITANLRPDGRDVDFFSFTELRPGTIVVAEIEDNGLDTLLGRFDDNGRLLEVDDDSGAELLSRLANIVPENGVLNYAVSGYPDFDFNGLADFESSVHGQSGDYRVLLRTFSPVVEETAGLNNSSFESREFVASPTGTILGGSLREDGADRDFFEMTGMLPGAIFDVELVAPNFAANLGLPNAAGDVADLASGELGASVRLFGQVPQSGAVVLAVTGFGDADFDGELDSGDAVHGASGDYALSFRLGTDIPDDSTTTASVATGGDVFGRIDFASDEDWFQAHLVGGNTYRINLARDFTSDNPLADPFFRGVYDASGNLIPDTANDDASSTLDSQVFFSPSSTGTYYLSAGAFGSELGNYRLSLVDLGDLPDDVGDTPETAGAIALNVPIEGLIDNPRDADWYGVELSAGTLYEVRLQGAPSGSGSLADPLFAGVYTASGTSIPGTSNDDSDGSLDSREIFIAPDDGIFYLSAASYTTSDGLDGTYRLTIAPYVGPSDVPSNVTTTASIDVGGTYDGRISFVDDEDWIGFDAVAGESYTVSQIGVGEESAALADPLIAGVYTSSGTVLDGSGNDDFGGTLNARATFTALETGRHFISASAFGENVGEYRLSLARSVDDLPPRLVSTSPTDDSTDVDVGATIDLIFDEPVAPGNGAFVISGGGAPISIDADDAAQVRFNNGIVTIDPVVNLASNTDYNLTFASGVVEDLAGNAFPGINDSTTFNFRTGSTTTLDDWTLMIYIAGDNNLADAAFDDLNEIESVDLPESVNVAVLLDGNPNYGGAWADTRRGFAEFDNGDFASYSDLESLGELNTGDPATLTDFINWSVSNSPASNYGLIIWDHGAHLSGWAWDDTDDHDNLDYGDVRAAIEASSLDSFQLLGFDACLSQYAETNFEYAQYADVIVGSQDTEPFDGWAYDDFLAAFEGRPNLSAVELGAEIVETYADFYGGQLSITQSATLTSELGKLADSLDAFADFALSFATPDDLDALRDAQARVHRFTTSESVDLGDFIDLVEGSDLSAGLRDAASQVSESIDAVVAAEAGTVARASGLGIYLPEAGEAVRSDYTEENFAFLSEGNVPSWDNFLASLEPSGDSTVV